MTDEHSDIIHRMLRDLDEEDATPRDRSAAMAADGPWNSPPTSVARRTTEWKRYPTAPTVARGPWLSLWTTTTSRGCAGLDFDGVRGYEHGGSRHSRPLPG
jgi:hypothetical protein